MSLAFGSIIFVIIIVTIIEQIMNRSLLKETFNPVRYREAHEMLRYPNNHSPDALLDAWNYVQKHKGMNQCS